MTPNYSMDKKLMLLFLLLIAFNDVSFGKQKKDKNGTTQENEQKKKCCCEPEKSDCIITEENAKTIILDFKTKQIQFDDKYIQKGNAVQIQVVNYNPFLYKIILENSDSTVLAPTDGSLLSFFLDPSNLSGIVANIAANLGKPVPLTTERENFFKAKVSGSPKKFIEEAYEIEFSDFIKAKSKIDINELVKKIQLEHLDVLHIRQEKIDKLLSEISELLYGYKKKLFVQYSLYPDCETFKLNSDVEVKEIETKLKSKRDEITTAINETNEDFKKYSFATYDYRKFIDTTASAKNIDTLIRQFYTKANAALTNAQYEISFSKQSELISAFNKVAIASSCYKSFPIFLTDDVKKISIKLQPKYDSLPLSSYSTSFNLPWAQNQIWGISAGFNYSGLVSENYNIRTDHILSKTGQYDTVYSIIREKRTSNGEMGINALAYTAWYINDKRTSYLGASIGTGLTITSKVKPRLLAGFTYVHGSRNRLLLSVGFIAGYVSTLSSSYNTDQAYIIPPSNTTVDVLKAHGFISFNYSFFSK